MRPYKPAGLAKLRNYTSRLIQPRYWPELTKLAVRKVTRALVGVPERDKRDAAAWCSGRALDIDAGMEALGFASRTMIRLDEAFKEEFTAAGARVQQCPHVMGGAANTDLLYNLCELLRAEAVLETGVAYGWSTLAILLSIRHRDNAYLHSVDLPYLGAGADDHVGIAVADDLHGMWTLHRQSDRKALPKLIKLGTVFDLIHYDSDKTYIGRIWAYNTLWPALRVGGILVSDDIQDNFAFADFAESLKLIPVIIRDPKEEKYAGLLRKRSDNSNGGLGTDWR
jgi:predicted O-methyltransferase YrrM